MKATTALTLHSIPTRGHCEYTRIRWTRVKTTIFSTPCSCVCDCEPRAILSRGRRASGASCGSTGGMRCARDAVVERCVVERTRVIKPNSVKSQVKGPAFVHLDGDRRLAARVGQAATVQRSTSTTTTTNTIPAELSPSPNVLGRLQTLPPSRLWSDKMSDEDREQIRIRTLTARCDEASPVSSPITQLPFELLAATFLMVSRNEMPNELRRFQPHSDHRPETRMSWVRLMLVCRHWYNVGQSSPQLWRRISITRNIQSLDYRLSRTVGSTIDVFFSSDGSVNHSAMSLLIPFAPYIRSLQTPNRFRFGDLPSIKPLLQTRLPALEYVKVLPYPTLLGGSQSGHSDGPGDWFDLGLSKDLHPHLRKLEIRRIVLPSPPSFFSALRELIINLHGMKNPPMYPQDVVNVLAHSPGLRALEISSSPTLWNYPPDFEVPGGVASDQLEPRCRLPNLGKISLKCPYHFAASVLQVVDAPNLAIFFVDVSASTPIVAAEIGPLIFPPSLRHIVHRLTRLRVAASNPSGFNIYGVSHITPPCCPHDVDRRFTLDVSVRDSTESIDPLGAALSVLWNAFAGHASVDSLDFVDFKMDDPSPNMWVPLHATFPALASLRVACPAPVATSFLKALLASSESVEGSWLTQLCHLKINTTCRSYQPLDSRTLHDIFDLLLDALLARWRKHNACMRMRLTLEHAMKTSTPLAAHRWMLHAISSLCDGFMLKRRDTPSRCFEVEVPELFKPGELRRWSREARGAIRVSAWASDSEDSESEAQDTDTDTDTDDTVETSTNGDGDLHSDENDTATARADEGERAKYSKFLSMVVKELSQLL